MAAPANVVVSAELAPLSTRTRWMSMPIKQHASAKILNLNIGLANRGRTTKPKAAISDAEMKEQEILKQVNKCKGSVAASITKASAAVKNLIGNKHALASKMKTQLEQHHTSLQNRLSDVDKVLNDLQAMVKVKQPYLDKIMNSAKTAVDNFNKDVKIAKSL